MSFQKYLKRIKRRLENLDFFYLAIGGGLESSFLYKKLKELGFNFKPIVAILDDRSRRVSSSFKDSEKITLEYNFNDVISVFPKKPYFFYYSIVRRSLEKFAIDKETYVVLPESSEEVFIHLLYRFLSGNIQKIYKHKENSEEFRIINPIFDISRDEILWYSMDERINYIENPYKEDPYYKSLLRATSEILKNYEDVGSLISSIINRNVRVINLKILKCERCGYPSLSKVCDLCKIESRVKAFLKKEEREKNKKKKRKLRPVRRLLKVKRK